MHPIMEEVTEARKRSTVTRTSRNKVQIGVREWFEELLPFDVEHRK